MNRSERDDIKHALSYTLEFFEKELPEQKWAGWWTVLQHLDPELVKRAMKDYLGQGKFAPKPKDIVDLVRSYGEFARRDKSHDEPERIVEAPREIQLAWKWLIAKTTADTGMAMYQQYGNVSDELAERYLHIVNHEAERTGQIDAVPDELKLRAVWGERGRI